MQARLGITQHLIREGVARIDIERDASGKVSVGRESLNNYLTTYSDRECLGAC
jgi:hypothetical protein